jgi:hypothetical protein
MRVPSVLLLSLLIALCVSNAAAQSRPVQTSDNPELLSVPPRTPDVDSRPQHLLTLEQNADTCYTIRAYRVARENPESDLTRPVGYSTCQRSTRFQLKTAVDSRPVVPR